jgi:hypothetical protein
MATYREIQDDIRSKEGRAIKTCWIAHVKELNGLAPRTAPNRRTSDERVYPCPPDMRLLIEASMRRLGVLKAA